MPLHGEFECCMSPGVHARMLAAAFAPTPCTMLLVAEFGLAGGTGGEPNSFAISASRVSLAASYARELCVGL